MSLGQRVVLVMDPLGAKPATVSASDLPSWADTESDSEVLKNYASSLTNFPNAHSISPFLIREDLNKKVALW